ncbi:aldo/keto reductase [Roseivivax sp. THAF30]|uniref:aldo/keto reductase n=1 Tax=Roseivivax sp. THAF30 TaxID=2587852 RepID=UPI0012693747|nr:aldo/keto reductase [Roseivivax sp. THAF30]QFT62631.1 General stress protein 69 [Roseivivax sp. THAF30]
MTNTALPSRILGQSGLSLTAIGLGAMNISGFYGPSTEEEAFALFDKAAELGIDHLDTSNVYGMGHSEEVIGRYLASRGPIFRIATKAGICSDPKTGGRFYDNSRGHLTASLEASLARLGLEAVDLFYVHRREAARPIEEVTESLAELKASGRTKAVGFSEISPASLDRAMAVHLVDAVQSEYSLATRAPELGLVQACERHAVALVAFSPVGRGFLTDTPPDMARVEGSAFLRSNPRFHEPNFAYNLASSDRFRQLAADFEAPAASLAIAWLLSRSETVIPIPGTRSPRHLEEAARGATMRLGAEDLARIEEALPPGWAHGDRYSETQWHGPERFA